MQRAMVIGGSGFIGMALVRQLVAQGVETAVISRHGRPELNELEVQFIPGDIRNLAFLKESLKGFDTVFHLAAKKSIWGPGEEFHQINVVGTENVITACRANQVRYLIYTSIASVVFEGVDMCGVNELTPYAGRYHSPYPLTKAAAERLVLAANDEQLKTTVLRPHLVWGPEENQLLPWLIKTGSRRQLKKVGNGRNLVDITYIDNAATAHLLAAEHLHTTGKPAGDVYFITQGEPVNLWNWLNKLLRMLELPQVEETVSFRKAYWTGFFLEAMHRFFGIGRKPRMTRYLAEVLSRSHWFSGEKAERDLGYVPTVSTLEGLHRTVEWVRRAE